MCPLPLSVVLVSLWERSHSQERDFWEDGRPADHPVRGLGQRRHHVLRGPERRHLRVEGTQPDPDSSGCTRGESAAWFSSINEVK